MAATTSFEVNNFSPIFFSLLFSCFSLDAITVSLKPVFAPVGNADILDGALDGTSFAALTLGRILNLESFAFFFCFSSFFSILASSSSLYCGVRLRSFIAFISVWISDSLCFLFSSSLASCFLFSSSLAFCCLSISAFLSSSLATDSTSLFAIAEL